MRNFIATFLFFFVRVLLSLRYRIKLTNKKELKKLNKKEPVLFLPNHPALMDPVILAMYMWPHYHMRPLVVEYVFRQPGVNMLMRLINALSVPDFGTSMNDLKIQKAKESIDEIIEGIKRKESFLLYPSGRLKHTGKELLGGASALQTILEECPDVQVVLVRTEGLWGSSFSRAYGNRSPDLKTTLLHAAKRVFQNLLFFMPRRKVTMDFYVPKDEFPRHGTRLDVNRFLEDWYNRYHEGGKIVDTEPLYKVSYLRWKKSYLESYQKKKAKASKGKRAFASETEERIFEEIAKITSTPIDDIDPSMDLAMDLGIDSLDIAELATFLNVHYEVGEVHPEDMVTVEDLLALAEGKKKTVRKKEETPTVTWPEEKVKRTAIPPEGKTIIEAFLRTCDRLKNAPACGDDVSGVMSYRKMKASIVILAEELKTIPGKYIGVLLPASNAAYLVVMALYLAKKVPVMLNWTLGPRYLNHMIEITGAEMVISSWKFIERLSNVEFGEVAKKIVYMEDVRKKISKKKKLFGFIKSMRSAKYLVKKYIPNLTKEDTAVVLFTSGTEAAPKGVPLSHNNILENQRSLLKAIEIVSEDTFYGALPPFHSFGFSVAGILPLLYGVKVAYFPDPTDSYSLAEGIDRWGISIICLAPSFMKGLLQAAKRKQLKTMRIFVTGAEKAPKELFSQVGLLGEGKSLVEGYGITECSPGLTMTYVDKPSKGVGKFILGIEAITVNPETHKVLEKGREGEICVHGESVFKGYLGSQKSPFLEVDGKTYYMTGDLGHVDKEGFLILSGRLKRFTKVGGEMISLAAVEIVIIDAFLEQEREWENEPAFAVCANEIEGGKTSLVLFTTVELDQHEVNQVLKDAGFSRLVKISTIRTIDVMPLMGTGKKDYRFLQSLINSQ